MPYASYKPWPALASLVERIWIQESSTNAATADCGPTRVIPTGSVDIAFYYREPFYRLCEGNRELLPGVVVTGPQTTYRQYGATARTGIVLVRFFPGAASSILGIPLHAVRDRDVGLDELLPPARVRAIEDHLHELRNNTLRVAAVQRFLLESVRPTRHAIRASAAVQLIRRGRGTLNVQAVAQRMHLGPRQIERVFRDSVGLGPKLYSRIVRFQSALERHRSGMSWSEVAHSGGYHDQAHLCSDCASFTGLTPVRLARRAQETALARFFNSESETTGFSKTTYV